MKHRYLVLIFAAVFSSGALRAQVPPLINYQGRVVVGAQNFDGAGQFKFALVNADGTTTFWSNDGTSVAGGEPANAVTLTVDRGLYSVLLGDVVLGNMTAIPPTLFVNPDVRLRVWFDDGLNGSQLLSPDERLAPTAYIADGAVTSTSIADGAITSSKIADGAVTGTSIAPASLDFTRLAVPTPPGPGQVLGFDGASLTWTAPGNGVFSLNGTSAYYNGGKVGIGTSTPATKLAVFTQIGSYAFGTTPGVQHTDGNVSLGTSIGTFGFADGGGFGTFSNHPLNFFVNNGPPSVTIDGSGTTFAAGQGTAGFGSPNGESGMTFKRAGFSNRADLRWDGVTIKLVAGPASGPPASGSGIAITTAGNVGIGTTSPVSKLDIAAQDGMSITGFQPFLTLKDANANNARSRIQSAGGQLNFFTESYLNGSNSNNYAALASNGNFTVKSLTIRGGADLAEPFQMKEEELEKGSVVVIDEEHPGRLKRSTSAYDRRVAGIVSGANGINAGIDLQQEGVIGGGQNVALTGRVYVLADATGAPIRAGDLLTTSETPGHAMPVRDHIRAQGAVLGKAMTQLDEGTGYVLVLVSLQ